MFDSIKSFLNKFSEFVYSKPRYFGTLQLIELIIFIKLIYWDNLLNLSIAYPIFTQYFVLSIIFFYLLLFFFLSIKSASNTTNTTNTSPNVPTDTNIFFKALSIISFLLVSVFIIFGIVWLITHNSEFFKGSTFHYIFLSLIVICSVTIVYKLVSKFLPDNMMQYISFFFNVLFFIPCLLLRFIDYIKFQFKITTKPIWILLGIEFILIALWIVIPKLINTISTHSDGIQLLTEPLYIRHPVTLGTFENLHEENIDKGIKFKYNYSLSAWFYINPQPPSTSPGYTKYTTILNYGNKPKLQYNGLLNSLRVVSESGIGGKGNDIEIFETKDIIYQKWNNIVINYDGGTTDVFLNGELVGSSPNVVSYMRYENVEIGDLNGIQGGICNVIFHNSIMPKSKIVSSYRLLRNKEVPTTF
jgi:hypothetical protein